MFGRGEVRANASPSSLRPLGCLTQPLVIARLPTAGMGRSCVDRTYRQLPSLACGRAHHRRISECGLILCFISAHGARCVYVERVAHRVQRHRHFPLRSTHPVNHLSFGPFLWWSTWWCGVTATPAKGQNNTRCRHRKLLETVVHCYESGGASPISALLLSGLQR